MATVKKYQKGGMVSTVKKAAAKAVETVKKSAPKSNPFKNVADLSKTVGQRFLSKDKVEMKNGGKAQNGKKLQVSIPKKLAPKGPDTKIKAAFDSTAKKAKSGTKMKKGC